MKRNCLVLQGKGFSFWPSRHGSFGSASVGRTLAEACMIPDLSPTNACIYVCKYADKKPSSATMLGTKRSAGVTQEVNLRNPLHTGDKACKRGNYPDFETQSRHHQKSKTGVSVAPQKRTDALQKIKKQVFLSQALNF